MTHLTATLALFLFAISQAHATFSIVAYDPETGDLGIAVQSKFFGVGSVVPWAKAGVGAIATQAYANTTYGPRGLALLAKGKSAAETLDHLTSSDLQADRRQVGIVDAQGRPAAFTGGNCFTVAAHLTNANVCVQGNILASTNVVPDMLTAFQAAREQEDSDLADALLAALVAGQNAGGDKRGQQSASILVVRKQGGYAGMNDRYIDIRVEDHPRPIEELQRLLNLHRKFYAPKHRLRPPKKSK